MMSQMTITGLGFGLMKTIGVQIVQEQVLSNRIVMNAEQNGDGKIVEQWI